MTEEDIRIGVFVCDCGLNIAGSVDCEEVRKSAEELPGVVVSVRNKYTCADPGQDEIKKYIREHNLNRVVVAACTPRMHEPTFQNCVSEAGLKSVRGRDTRRRHRDRRQGADRTSLPAGQPAEDRSAEAAAGSSAAVSNAGARTSGQACQEERAQTHRNGSGRSQRQADSRRPSGA